MICVTKPRPTDPYMPTWHLLHDWTRWGRHGLTYQRRSCLRCGKIQVSS